MAPCSISTPFLLLTLLYSGVFIQFMPSQMHLVPEKFRQGSRTLGLHQTLRQDFLAPAFLSLKYTRVFTWGHPYSKTCVEAGSTLISRTGFMPNPRNPLLHTSRSRMNGPGRPRRFPWVLHRRSHRPIAEMACPVESESTKAKRLWRHQVE